MGLLAGKAAVVTGGAQGIGLEIARTFALEGAAVVIADVHADQAQVAASSVSSEVAGAQVHAVACDVRQESDVDAVVTGCVGLFGSLDILVNNAGITLDATMRKMTLEDFRAVIDVNLVGCWLGTRRAALSMREQGSGSIINMSSISGKVGFVGQTNYSAAKAGIVGLTKAAAKELAYLGVRVNAIQPGLIRTAMTEAVRADIWEKKMAEIPMARAGEPREVANVALFLASDLASYLTGTVIEVTGGRHI